MRKHAILVASLLLAACVDFGPEEAVGQGRIAGTITEVPSGDRVEGAEILVQFGDTTIIAAAGNGNYLVTRLLPGNYVVTIDPPSGYELAPNTFASVPVQIVADETRMVNFLLRSVTSTSVPPQARN
jgi:hypothetical protein